MKKRLYQHTCILSMRWNQDSIKKQAYPSTNKQYTEIHYTNYKINTHSVDNIVRVNKYTTKYTIS